MIIPFTGLIFFKDQNGWFDHQFNVFILYSHFDHYIPPFFNYNSMVRLKLLVSNCFVNLKVRVREMSLAKCEGYICSVCWPLSMPFEPGLFNLSSLHSFILFKEAHFLCGIFKTSIFRFSSQDEEDGQRWDKASLVLTTCFVRLHPSLLIHVLKSSTPDTNPGVTCV